MVETPLCALARKYGTDKGGRPEGHHYTQHYYNMLAGRDVKTVLEIGICGNRNIPNNRIGASLFMWQEFFPGAKIFGIDNDPKWMITEDHIMSALADQSDPISLRAAMNKFYGNGGQSFDLIIDDGSHQPAHQLTSMQTLLPYLSTEGIYFIEDVACAPEILTTHIPTDQYYYIVIPEKMVRVKDQSLIAIKRHAPD